MIPLAAFAATLLACVGAHRHEDTPRGWACAIGAWVAAVPGLVVGCAG